MTLWQQGYDQVPVCEWRAESRRMHGDTCVLADLCVCVAGAAEKAKQEIQCELIKPMIWQHFDKLVCVSK